MAKWSDDAKIASVRRNFRVEVAHPMTDSAAYQPRNFFPPPAVPLKGPRQFSILGAMIRVPLFSAAVSRDVARNWKGFGFWYLFLLLLMTWAVVMVRVHLITIAFVRDEVPRLLNNIPPITIRNGHVTSPVTQPYYIPGTKTEKPFAVLDTTGEINSLDDTDAMVLITDHKMWSRQNNQVKEYDLSKLKNFYIDKNKINSWLEPLSRYLAIGILPLALVGSLCWRLVEALIFGTIALGFANGFGASLEYPAALRLAVVSLTPILLLDTILWTGGWHIPMWWLIGLGISILYIAMAVKANSSNSPPTIPQ